MVNFYTTFTDSESIQMNPRNQNDGVPVSVALTAALGENPYERINPEGVLSAMLELIRNETNTKPSAFNNKSTLFTVHEKHKEPKQNETYCGFKPGFLIGKKF
jgi:hypothetical protein